MTSSTSRNERLAELIEQHGIYALASGDVRDILAALRVAPSETRDSGGVFTDEHAAELDAVEAAMSNDKRREENEGLALPLTSHDAGGFGWLVADANKRVVGYCLTERQARQMTAAVNVSALEDVVTPSHVGSLSEFVHAAPEVREAIGNDVAKRAIERQQATLTASSTRAIGAKGNELHQAAKWVLALIDGGEQMPKPGDEVAEELRAAVEAEDQRVSRMGTHWVGCGMEGGVKHYECLQREYRELLARSATRTNSDDARDAARYRWLREHPKGQFTDSQEKEWWPSVWMSKDAEYPLQAGYLDQVVDAAIRMDEMAPLIEEYGPRNATESRNDFTKEKP